MVLDIELLITIGSVIASCLTTTITLSRKIVTKEQFEELVKSIESVTERVVNLEKKTALLEYRLDQVEKEGKNAK